MNRLGLGLFLCLLPLVACEVFDPPPTVSLEVPEGGVWFADTPLTLRFSEPIDRDSFTFTIWPLEYGPEGDIASDALALVADCSLTSATCGPMTIDFNAAGDEIVLGHSDLFADKLGTPFILQVHAGLMDTASRPRRVPTSFEFQISPTQDVGAVEVNLNSGVLLMVSDFSAAIPGVYLRLMLDLVVDESTGKSWVAGTVLSLDPSLGLPPETSDPTAMNLYDDHQGWTVYLEGQVSALSDGRLFLRTDPVTVTVNVLGFIWVQLQDFQLEATIEPGMGAGGRDIASGLMTTSRALMNGPDDPDDLGDIASALVMKGIFLEEVPVELPQICEENPCEHMNEAGGDCQLASPWTKAPACP